MHRLLQRLKNQISSPYSRTLPESHQGREPLVVTSNLLVTTSPSNRRGGVRVVQYLPYSRWLDYCTIAFFVREETARTSMAAILARLANVSAAEAAAKHAALSRVREAFVFRPGCSPGAPCATEHILGEMCDAAVRGGRRGGHQTTESAWAAGGDHQRCVLG